MIWDIVIMFFAFVTAVIVPFDVAWNVAELTGIQELAVIDLFSFLLFLVDIILSFRTTIVNKFGEEIKNPKEIMLLYVFSKNFIIDVIVIIQLDQIF